MPLDEEKQEKHWVQRWFSFGDLTSLVVMLVVFVGGYAQLRRDVQVLQRDVNDMKEVQITPGAATRLSSLETSVQWMQRAAEEDRRQSAEFRADMRAQMARIEAALQTHAGNDR